MLLLGHYHDKVDVLEGTNECTSGTYPCDANADCTPINVDVMTADGQTCTCTFGYAGDGTLTGTGCTGTMREIAISKSSFQIDGKQHFLYKLILMKIILVFLTYCNVVNPVLFMAIKCLQCILRPWNKQQSTVFQK